MSKPAKPIPTLSCPWLAAAVIKMPVMVPGIRKGPKKASKRSSGPGRACLCGCPQPAVAEAPTALVALIRFLSVRL